MTNEEWANSDNAQYMLKMLHREQPDFLAKQISQLHRYFIACCWKNKHLTPQKHLLSGLKGAERWLAGELTDEELNNLDWYAEAEAFVIDYAKTPEQIAELEHLISGIDELDGVTFSEARQLVRDAAYFANTSIIYSNIRNLPWVKSLFESQFLCPDLLRKFIKPKF